MEILIFSFKKMYLKTSFVKWRPFCPEEDEFKAMWLIWDTIDVIIYRQVSNISNTLGGNKIVDHTDVVAASPVGAAPTTSSFST